MPLPSALSASLYRLCSIAVVVALLVTTAFGAAPPVSAAAQAGLTIVNVGAPAINCLFDTDCTITVNDLASNFTPPGATGNGFLQSRLWPVGQAGTAGAGLYAYLYRIDLRKAVALTAISCVEQLTLDFGSIAQLDYNSDKTPDDVFVVTQGGLGNISPATASQTGDTITFTFKPAICPGTRAAAGDSSFFFGLASTKPAQDVSAQLSGSSNLAETLAARAPRSTQTLSGKIAYVFKEETTVAPAFQGLLQAQGFSVTLVPLNNVLTTDFSAFDLTIVANDTGSLDSWGNAAGQVEQIAKHSPVLGIAEGGYAFFGKLNLNIGWPHGWHSTLDTVVGNASLSFYQTPTDLTGLLGAPLAIASPAVAEVGIHLPEPIAGVTVLGTEPASATHHPLIAEGCNQLWGYNTVPALNMTSNGEKLFVNAVVYALNQCKRQPPALCEELFSPRQIPSAAQVNFDDLPDATTIADSYAASHGLHFYSGNDTKVITYADRTSDPTKARSKPNVATNNSAPPPASSSDVPLTFTFDQPKSHVGFYMGNGENQQLRGTLVAYDVNDKVICQVTNSPVPETYSEFIGVHDSQGRIVKLTLDYGESIISEAIDDLYFAPYAKPVVFPEPEAPPQQSTMPTVTVESSTNQTFTAKIDLPNPQFIAVQGGDNISYTHMILPGVDIYGNTPGQPDVPVVRRLLGVPRGAEVKLAGLEVIPGDESTILLYPAQQSGVDVPLAQGGDGELPPETFADLPFAKDPAAYAADQLFPAEIVQIQPVGRLRDLDLVQLNIASGQYNPKTKLLKRFQSVKFELQFVGGQGGFLPKNKLSNPFEQSFDGNYAQVINQAALSRYPFEELINPPSCLGHEFIIVTAPTFRPAANALRTWKVSRGLSTLVVETGNDANDAGTSREQIRNYVRSRYNNCLVRPSYLLLLGDAEFIPPFYRATGQSAALYAGTDLDYSLMVDGDIMPDLAYGRIPVDTLEDANRVVNKIINYEKLPPAIPAFYKNMTIASYFQCCRPDVVNDGTDSRSFLETSELVRNAMQTKGYTVERIYDTNRAYHNDPSKSSYYPPSRSAVPNRYYNGALLPADLRASSGYVWDGNSSDVIDAFNNSRFLILHRDHGGPSGWGDPGFSSSNLASLTNGNRTPVVYSINCASGLFDNETLDPNVQDWNYNTMVGSSYWAERLLRMDGGAVGIIGDTRNSPTWANSALTRGLFDATWPQTLPGYGGNVSYRRLGDILNYGKAYVVSQVGVAQTAGSVSSGDATTEVVLYHVFGDPTMKIWTSYPYIVNFPGYIYENLTINLNNYEVHYPINGATITALQDGAPVGRAEVVDGKAVLTLIDKVDSSKPVEFSASNPDGTGAALGQAEADGTITPEQGDLIEHQPSQFSLEFDNGAVDVATDIFYDVIAAPSQPLPAGQKGLRHFLLNAFDEAASDGNPAPVTQFAKPFTLALGYSDGELAAFGLDEASLSCRYLDTATNQWQTIPSQVDAAKNQVTCTADHFTEFALAGNVTQATQSLFLPVVSK